VTSSGSLVATSESAATNETSVGASGVSKTTVAIVGASTPLSGALAARPLNWTVPFSLSMFVTGSPSNSPSPPETFTTAVASGSKVRCA